jgi:hypothetical protein
MTSIAGGFDPQTTQYGSQSTVPSDFTTIGTVVTPAETSAALTPAQSSALAAVFESTPTELSPQQSYLAHQAHLHRVVTTIAITLATILLLIILGAIAWIVFRRRKQATKSHYHEGGELKDLSPGSSSASSAARQPLGSGPLHGPIPQGNPMPILQRHNSTYNSGIDYEEAEREGGAVVGPGGPVMSIEHPSDPPPPYQARLSFAGRSGPSSHPNPAASEAADRLQPNRQRDADNVSMISDVDRGRAASVHQMV